MLYINKLMELAVDNKYAKWYCSIICTAALRGKSKKVAKDLCNGYVELHHILPKGLKLGGEKDKLNFVFLTAKEHLVCHLLLPKMLTGKNRHIMAYGMRSMLNLTTSGQQRPYKITGAMYEYIKREVAAARKHFVPWNKGLKTGQIPWNKGMSGYKFDEEASHNHRVAHQKFKQNNPERYSNIYKNLKMVGEPKRLLAIQKKTAVFGVVYDSATIAAKEFGLKKTTMIKRILSKNYPDYMYVGENK